MAIYSVLRYPDGNHFPFSNTVSTKKLARAVDLRGCRFSCSHRKRNSSFRVSGLVASRYSAKQCHGKRAL